MVKSNKIIKTSKYLPKNIIYILLSIVIIVVLLYILYTLFKKNKNYESFANPCPENKKRCPDYTCPPCIN